MNFFDVLFPLNMGALTYRCPEALTGRVKPGMIVSVSLKSRITKGVVIGESAQAPPGDTKDIQEVHGDVPILSAKLIELLKWISDYYMAGQGLVLRNVLPKEAFTKVNPRKTNIRIPKGYHFSAFDVDVSMSARLINAMNSAAYGTFLLYPTSFAYECPLLIKILAEIRNSIILVPEISMVNDLYPILVERFGERIALFHSELSRGKRSDAIRRIISGRSDIVLGTRSAVFAPLQKVSFIAVLHEHSVSYKQENTPCYNARDVAVMRGYLEKATVMLSSACPSIESFFNCKTGKYTLLTPVPEIKRPRIRLVDMRHENLARQYLSKPVIDAAIRHINNSGNIVFVVNRRGYSLLQCTDCGRIEECPNCKIPLVFHKQDMSMKCHYCGYTSLVIPERCSDCKGFNLKLSGAGTQKIQEDIEDITQIKTLRIDSDRAKRKTDLDLMIGAAFACDPKIIIGTKLMTGRLGIMGRLSMAAILNTDLFLNIPDFRSAEKAYQDIIAVADKIDPEGEVLVQTRMPQNYLFRYLKTYDYNSFFKEELNRRKSLAYPPYSRLLLLKFTGKRDLIRELSEISARTDEEVEILGPYISKNKRGKDEYKLLMKSSVRGKLQSTAKLFIEAFRETKDVRTKVDMDPTVI